VIDGVHVRQLTTHADARGSLTEVLRRDDPGFAGFGQAIVTINQPGIIRGWHWHHRQTDTIVVIKGRVVLPLYDGRVGSKTFGKIEEHVADGEHLFALVVPPGVYHGYKTIGSEAAMILNFPSELYDPAAPDEERVPHDAPHIRYDWGDRA
jgi:dTDP-4-dehydrorhamnose 3,5-epimerase